MFKTTTIDISIFHYVTCSQLLLLSFPKVVSMNTFNNDQINVLLQIILFLCIDNFYFLWVFIACDEQTFRYSVKYGSFKKNVTQICSGFSISLPRVLILKPRPRWISKWKLILMFIRIYKNLSIFQDIRFQA